MEFDIFKLHDCIVKELVQRRPIAESMSRLFDLCEAGRPHPDWAKLRALPYSDLSELLKWVKKPFREQPPTRPLQGLWFGLFNPCYDGQNPLADIYVCGSERFNADPQDNSWAGDPEWWPDARYAHSALMADIFRIAYPLGIGSSENERFLGNDAEYPVCLGYGAFAVRDLLESVEQSLILGESEALGVAVGFDSGDFVLLGQYRSSGFAPAH